MTMMFTPELHGRFVQERIDRELATDALLRLARQPSTSVRRAVGHRIIRLGARLAAEPSFETVRSR
jgi:hypothetical protein